LNDAAGGDHIKTLNDVQLDKGIADTLVSIEELRAVASVTQLSCGLQASACDEPWRETSTHCSQQPFLRPLNP
jgi:hypothetical protein